MENSTLPSIPRPVIFVENIREILSLPERWDYMRESIKIELESVTGKENSVEVLDIRIIQRK